MNLSQLSPTDRKWLERGRTLSGVDIIKDNNSSLLPEWVDPTLVKEGQDFVRRNFFAVIFAHLLSLLFLLCYGPIRSVLLATGRSHSPHNSKLRYFSTLLHIKKWYEGCDDLLKPASGPSCSSTVHDIIKVTRIHAGVVGRFRQRSTPSFRRTQNQDQGFKMEEEQKPEYGDHDHDLIDAIQQDLSQFIDPNNNNMDDLYPLDPEHDGDLLDLPIISQLDMAVTQFCFMGFLPLFPTELGVPLSETEEGRSGSRGLAGFLHLWALFGHYLGIQREFNLALPENEGLRGLVWTQLLLPHFSSCHPQTLRLWEWLIQGISSFIPFITLKSLLLFITHRLLKVDQDKNILWGRLGPRQLLSFHLMRFCFGSWLQMGVGRILFNGLLRWTIFLFNLSLKLHIHI